MTSSWYDFNLKFSPLPVLAQGSNDCLPETRALMVDAWMRLYDGKHPDWDQRKVLWTATDNPCVFTVATPAGPRTAGYGSSCYNGDYFAERGGTLTRKALTFAIRHNGIMALTIPGDVAAFATCRPQQTMFQSLPRIDYHRRDGDPTLNHALLAVGVRPHGLLVQNSWGRTWGKRGRAILTWNFLARYGCQVIVYTWGDHPLDSLDL